MSHGTEKKEEHFNKLCACIQDSSKILIEVQKMHD